MAAGLEARAQAAAESAVCTRCEGLMVRKRLINQLITGTHRWVGERGVKHFNLCSDCGPEFRLFLAGEGF